MREVALSSEDMQLQETENNKQYNEQIEKKDVENFSSRMVRWEKFLPRMTLRVLLVEADDSTRQIIAALLRKCSYKVACVPDGLKAWELLKARPHNIDLILTEVDLPSISGYALLTLITEHEFCRNIPVIMMSSHDSIGTVYKCMLRGAADYLVKPLRINELKNLWQHVWRRQSLAVDNNQPQNESVAQEQVEGTAENNSASDNSSDRARAQKNKDCIEKGSDAQSSCTKPDLEADSAQIETTQDYLQPTKSRPLTSDPEIQKDEMSIQGECRSSYATPPGDVGSETQRRDANTANEASDNNYVLINSFKEPAGSHGALYGYGSCRYDGGASNCGMDIDSSPLLDLSLRRGDPSGFDNQVAKERKPLKLSSSSAFTRYVNKSLQPLNQPSTSPNNQHKEYGSISEKDPGLGTFKSDSLHHNLGTQNILLSLATGQSDQSETPTLCPDRKMFPVPLPVRATPLENVSNGRGSVFPPMLHTQLSLSPSPSSAGQHEPFNVTAMHRSNTGNSNSEWPHGQIKHKQEHKLEERGQISPTTDHSANSSFCNGAISHFNGIGYGSVGGSSSSNPDQFMGIKTASEIKFDGTSHRSSQREAALTKFRLKRKERCYEKRVRYESRKKLAEQRPRVKGQFVRQMEMDLPQVD